MKNLTLFSSKDKTKKFKCRLLQFSFVPLRVNSTLVYFGANKSKEFLLVQGIGCPQMVSNYLFLYISCTNLHLM